VARRSVGEERPADICTVLCPGSVDAIDLVLFEGSTQALIERWPIEIMPEGFSRMMRVQVAASPFC